MFLRRVSFEFKQKHSVLGMATASAERRQRLIEEAGDAAAFIKLGHDLVSTRSGLALDGRMIDTVRDLPASLQA